MVLHKHEIPILEFDTDKEAVLAPTHEALGLDLPKKCIYGFLDELIDDYAKAHGAHVVAEFISATKNYPIYVLAVDEQDICLVQAPVGAAAATQLMDWLIGYGVETIISTGSCGVLEDLAENIFLVPKLALRDEGTSYHYLPPSRYVETSPAARAAIEAAVLAKGFKYREVMTWTTDGFYRETKAKVAYRKAEGCAVVEMECAALAACAKLRDVTFGQLLYTADSLANLEAYDERDWGDASRQVAIDLCLSAILHLA